MDMDEVEFECPDCEEPVDDEGYSIEGPCCSYAPSCDTCGSAHCDQSC